MKKQECIICRKPLNDGIILYGRRICKNCEERLLNSNIDTDFYEYYKNCIKKTLIQFIPGGVNKECHNYHL